MDCLSSQKRKLKEEHQQSGETLLCSLSIPAWLLLSLQNPRANVQASHSYLEVIMALHIFFVVILKAYLSRAKNRTYFMSLV